MRQIFKILGFFILTLSSCSGGREVVMPFRNMGYSGDRLFPIEKNDTKKAFRAWINNGTSIDRVISVFSDSLFGNQAKLTELGFLDKKELFKSKSQRFFSEKKITPKCGYDRFFELADSLNLMNLADQDSFDYVLNHQPYSLYVIEIKKGKKYNQFQFRTHFPDRTMRIESKYQSIENFIFKEFSYDFYMK